VQLKEKQDENDKTYRANEREKLFYDTVHDERNIRCRGHLLKFINNRTLDMCVLSYII